MTDAAVGVHYHVSAHDVAAHLWRVRLVVDVAPSAELVVSLPVWLAGSYMVREFSKHLQGLSARQGKRSLAVTQLNKNTWSVACTRGKPVEINCDVYAHDPSVRSAWLSIDRGFFNATSLCLRVHGLDHLAHHISIVETPEVADWSVFTGLDPLRQARTASAKRGFTTYVACDYEQLADSPFELGQTQADGGRLWVGEFVARGTPHRFVVAGAWDSFDGARLLADTQRICETVIDFWHPSATASGTKASSRKRVAAVAPMARYTFMLNAVSDGYGGLEHHNSTALIARRADLPKTVDVAKSSAPLGEGYTTLLGLISHEYFHTWNVKRLRPAEFERYAFDAEQYTELLWFFEGFTSYFDDLLLCRSGLISHNAYVKLLEKTANNVLSVPGRFSQSVAQASFDAWVKYYRQDENSPNSGISYYTKGALVALCFDLTLRAEGHTTLDDVMRAVYARTHGGPMTEHDFAHALYELSGRSYSLEIEQWVHGTDDLPVRELLAAQGLGVTDQRIDAGPGLAASLGLRVSEGAAIAVKLVLNNTPAREAGFCAGDEWWALELNPESAKLATQSKATQKATQKAAAVRAPSVWRVGHMNDVRQLCAPGQTVWAWVARDQRVLRLALTMPPLSAQATALKLGVLDVSRVSVWLDNTWMPA